MTFQLSYPVVIVRARLLTIGKQYEEAAIDLGASPIGAMRRVLLPMLMPAIFASAVLVFADVIDDFVIVRYLSSDGSTEPVSVKIYNTARAAPTPALNALATLLLLASFLAVVLGLVIYRWISRGEGGRVLHRELRRRAVTRGRTAVLSQHRRRQGAFGCRRCAHRVRGPGRPVSHGPRQRPRGRVDVSEATAAAAEAFVSWRRTTPAERADALLAAADVLSRNADELVDLEVRDTGKPRRSMADEEIPACVDQLKFYAGAVRVLEGRAVGEYVEGVTSGIRREPIGVCGQVTPWNYPLMMAVWKWAPAVAAGNTVVLKPADLTPDVDRAHGRSCSRTCCQPGVLNVVCGGVSTGEHLVADERVAMVALTGSVRAGRAVAAAAAERLARVHLELGGNAPLIVFGDADLDGRVRGVVEGAYLNAGQDCTAAARVLVAPRCTTSSSTC